MNLTTTTTPSMQRRTSLASKALRLFLKTQVGKSVAFYAGLKGFDRVMAVPYTYIRDFRGEKLSRKERRIRVEIAPGEFVDRVFHRRDRMITFNSRVDVGAALAASLCSNTTLGGLSSPHAPNYIALSTATLTPAHGDTTLASETSATGLARAVGTVQNYVAPASLDAAASYDVYKQFTNTSGGSVTVVSSALFDASSTGNMFAEANLSSNAVLANNDLVQVTWTVNL